MAKGSRDRDNSNGTDTAFQRTYSC